MGFRAEKTIAHLRWPERTKQILCKIFVQEATKFCIFTRQIISLSKEKKAILDEHFRAQHI